MTDTEASSLTEAIERLRVDLDKHSRQLTRLLESTTPSRACPECSVTASAVATCKRDVCPMRSVVIPA